MVRLQRQLSTTAFDHGSTSRATDGYGRDRQVLVVGEGLTAVSTALFVAQAGLDPVVASTPDRSSSTELTVCWRSGLVLLERIGLRRPIERFGTSLENLDSLVDDRSWSADETNQSSLVSLDRDRLEAVFGSCGSERIRTANRAVTAVEPTEVGVRATFEQGLTEPFDAAITTNRSLLPSHNPVSIDQKIHCWEFTWPSTRPQPPAPAEAWGDRRATVAVPVDDGLGVRLLSAPDSAPPTPLSIAELEAQFGPLLGRYDPFGALDHHELRYSQRSQAVPKTRIDGPIALVGSGRRASVPGDCLDAALGIEDAWVIADALAYGPQSVEAALAAFERRRRNREREIAAWLANKVDRGATVSPWIRGLRAKRALAFSHVRGSGASLADAVPNRL